ncbi:hypothetical protein ACXYMU_16270 [Pontibacter sp. CAU 1760]
MNSMIPKIVCSVVWLVCLLSLRAEAQDLIITTQGEEIISKVLHIGTDTLRYRRFNDVTGPAFAMARQDVAQVRMMEQASTESNLEKNFTYEALELEERQQMLLQAKVDARAYYKARGVFWTTLGSTVLHPAVGLAAGTLIATMPPAIEADENPNGQLLKNEVYRQAYQEQAKKRKAGRAAMGFGTGIGVVSLLYVLVMNVGSLR